MAIDIGTLLKDVVVDVFGEEVDGIYSVDPQAPHIHRLEITDAGREVVLRATYEWADALIVEHDVGATLFDYGNTVAPKEASIRALALAMRAYLQGEAEVGTRTAGLRRRETPVVTLEVHGLPWVLGRRSSSTPLP